VLAQYDAEPGAPRARRARGEIKHSRW
jgi:hypothetical protein